MGVSCLCQQNSKRYVSTENILFEPNIITARTCSHKLMNINKINYEMLLPLFKMMQPFVLDTIVLSALYFYNFQVYCKRNALALTLNFCDAVALTDRSYNINYFVVLEQYKMRVITEL